MLKKKEKKDGGSNTLTSQVQPKAVAATKGRTMCCNKFHFSLKNKWFKADQKHENVACATVSLINAICWRRFCVTCCIVAAANEKSVMGIDYFQKKKTKSSDVIWSK